MLICPLTKSPQDDGGRLGPLEIQDWYVACRETERLAREHNAQVLVVSNVQIKGCKHEADIYRHALLELGVPEEKLLIEHYEYETIGQVFFALGKAREKNAELVFIASHAHMPRVKWLMRHTENVNVRYVATGGIPRPLELATDLPLIFGFPLMCLLGLQDWFQKKAQNRRKGGRH